jgi:hypothetical protein
MTSENFKASRWTRGNHLFRARVEEAPGILSGPEKLKLS